MDNYRYDEIKRVALEAAPFYRLQVSVDGSTVQSRHLNVTSSELFAIALMLFGHDNAGAEPVDPDVAHPFPVVEVTHAATRLPITSGEHLKRVTELHARLLGMTLVPDVPGLMAWWSYCAGETDERPS